MNSKTLRSPSVIIWTIIFLSNVTALAQNGTSNPRDLKKTILHHDSLFWQAYNACDIQGMEVYLTDDVEFYHDKAGLTNSRKKLVESIQAGLCGNPHWRLRREAIAGSLKVFPLEKYGAILSGEHIFFILEKGKKERLDGLAKFTHVWRYQDNEWKMHRILSYDHGPAPLKNVRKEVILSSTVLSQYAGKYQSAKAGVMSIEPDEKVLRLTVGDFQPTLFAESENLFFMKERDLQFEFVKENDRVVKVLIHENGAKVDEAVRADP